MLWPQAGSSTRLNAVKHAFVKVLGDRPVCPRYLPVIFHDSEASVVTPFSYFQPAFSGSRFSAEAATRNNLPMGTSTSSLVRAMTALKVECVEYAKSGGWGLLWNFIVRDLFLSVQHVLRMYIWPSHIASGCRQRVMFKEKYVCPTSSIRKVVSKRFLRVGLHTSDDYFAIAPPETRLSSRSSL